MKTERYRVSYAKRRKLPAGRKRLNWRRSDTGAILKVTGRENQLIILKSCLAAAALDYFFYRSLPAIIPLSGIGFLFYRLQREELWQKKRGEARDQFKELLLLVSTALKAGYSSENAFMSAYGDMESLYGADSSICSMLRILKTGQDNNMDISGVWRQIGEKTGILEIREFAEVYKISRQKSGNVSSVMDKTVEIIIQKIETEKEIEVLLSARRLEQKIMNITPFLIMLYIDLTSPGYFSGLYHSPSGAFVMSLCLGIYLMAYRLSVKLISIKV